MRIVIFSGAGDILTVNIGANVKLLLFVCFSFCYLNVVGCLEQCSSLITVFCDGKPGQISCLRGGDKTASFTKNRN